MKNKIWTIVALVEAILIIAGVVFSVITIRNLKIELDDSEKQIEALNQEDTEGLNGSLVKDGDKIIGVKVIWPEHIFRSQTADVIIKDKEGNEAYHFHYNLFYVYVIDEIEVKKYEYVKEFPGWRGSGDQLICKVDGEGNEMTLYLPPNTYSGYTIEAEFLNRSIPT